MSATAFEDALKAIKQILDKCLEDKEMIKRLSISDKMENEIAPYDPIQ